VSLVPPALFVCQVGSCTFVLAGLNQQPLFSTSQVAGITSVSNCTQQENESLKR
jgi:hypothetical protein